MRCTGGAAPRPAVLLVLVALCVYRRKGYRCAPAAKTPDLLAVGYHQPLPSEKKIRFRFEFASPRSEPAFREYLQGELAARGAGVGEVGRGWGEV